MSELETIAKKGGKHVRFRGVVKAKNYFKEVGEVKSVECLLLWWDELGFWDQGVVGLDLVLVEWWEEKPVVSELSRWWAIGDKCL